MTRPPHSLCIVSPLHLSQNPRVVKEACALQDAGYSVRVVSGRNDPRCDDADRELLHRHAWKVQRVDYTRRLGTLASEFLHRCARSVVRARPDSTWGAGLDRLAHHRAALALAAAAGEEHADLYLGHTVAGLAAAGHAANRRDASLGFDAEDFHCDETREAQLDPVLRSTVAAIERRWLPRCVHRTAASPLIADAYVAAYGIPRPTVVLNVFARREGLDAPRARPPGYVARRLYWYSQTIGPGRGLESLLTLLGAGKFVGTLALRGRPVPGYVDHLRSVARGAGFGGDIAVLPVAPPAVLVTLAAEHGAGLALEERTPRNRDLCLTNKVFTYLLAGLPVVLSPTLAQRALAAECGEATFVLDESPGPEAAGRLVAWLLDPATQARARARAWTLGQQRYCWDVEQTTLLTAIHAALGRAPASTIGPGTSP